MVAQSRFWHAPCIAGLMINRTGIGILASAGGLVAAVVCFLVGLQLLLLGAEIHSLLVSGSGPVDAPASAWKNLIQVSGWLSIFAGLLVVFLVVSERKGWRHAPGRDRGSVGESGDELEDISVRIFEVDDSNAMVEVTPDESAPENGPIDRPILAKDTTSTADWDSETILEEIEALTRPPGDPARSSWRSFLKRFLGR